MIHPPSTGFPCVGMPPDAADDWDLLLTALTARLRSAVGQQAGSSASNTQAHRIQHVVLECAVDLDRLHVALQAQGVQRRKLESHVGGLTEAVARAIADIGESSVPMTSTNGNPRSDKKASALHSIFG
ncbi:hypothetical protein ACSFBM_16770 [Variovorax sp. GB1R11]|uniref:hypothetical protein n=1 Tax=Variovorax sp. GB1R11 TaxID=3443741 RepID=UPI003F46DF6E